MLSVRIRSMGIYLPQNIITAEDVDAIAGVERGTIRSKVGIGTRRYVENETVSFMAKEAILDALKETELSIQDIDLICYTGASFEQPIPSTACLIQKHLGLENSGNACFDINSTCLSFVTAFDNLSYLIDSGRYKNVAIVASEIASKCINYNQIESAGLFGDGAVAMILSKSEDSACIHGALHKTYSAGSELCKVPYGGSAYPPNLKNFNSDTASKYLFDMNGPAVFKMSYKLLPDFTKKLLEIALMDLENIDMVVPHQASPSGMELIRKRIGIDKSKFINIVEEYGNMIAASIPMALYQGIASGSIKRGNRVMLLGTSAGVSIGGLVFTY